MYDDERQSDNPVETNKKEHVTYGFHSINQLCKEEEERTERREKREKRKRRERGERRREGLGRVVAIVDAFVCVHKWMVVGGVERRD